MIILNLRVPCLSLIFPGPVKKDASVGRGFIDSILTGSLFNPQRKPKLSSTYGPPPPRPHYGPPSTGYGPPGKNNFYNYQQ